MFEPPSQLAALVYGADEDPDALLRAFAADLNARGVRAVGLVQISATCENRPRLSAMLVHSGEQLQLFQDLGADAAGCKLDVGQLLAAGARVAGAIDAGADLVIINRFGRQERDGKGLSYLIERALSAETPVVIAVAQSRLADWNKFAGSMSMTMPCDRAALDAWWAAVSRCNESLGDDNAADALLKA